MRLAIGAARPSYLVPAARHVSSIRCGVLPKRVNLAKKWTEYQGCRNWEGLLDPLDENLRAEILRYGRFVQAAYQGFDYDPDSRSYATCQYSTQDLLPLCGLDDAGYLTTKHLTATSGIQLPGWIDRGPSWVSKQSSWIGYVAVTEDEREIQRLGRRDVVIAYRGTVTCLEWLENMRCMLTQLPGTTSDSGPMVESGFWSLYTSSTPTCRSLCEEVREEVGRILSTYKNDPISLTITGHSLGAALAVLTAYDIRTTFADSPFVTVISFGGPRVGNRGFRALIEEHGSNVLRIVNTHDVITKMPGIVLEDDVAEVREFPSWILDRLKDTRFLYADVGRELRISIGDSPLLGGHVGNVATCHDLDMYLHLVNGFLGETCPSKTTARRELLNWFPTQAAGFLKEKARVG